MDLEIYRKVLSIVRSTKWIYQTLLCEWYQRAPGWVDFGTGIA